MAEQGLKQKKAVIANYNAFAPASALCVKFQSPVPAVKPGHAGTVKPLLRPINKWDILS